MAAAVLVLITILLIRLSSREIVSEGLESSHEGEAATADDARAGDEDESVDGMGEVVVMMRREMMVRTLLDSSPAPWPSLHVTFAGGVLAADTIICSSLSSPTILLFTRRDHLTTALKLQYCQTGIGPETIGF